MPALRGRHQLANAATSITALSLLGLRQVDFGSVARALREVKLIGRIQKLPGSPLRFVDVAHNPQAAAALAQWARRQGDGPISALCAMYSDKDLQGTVHELRDVVHSWHLASLPPPRGASARTLAGAVQQAAPHAPIFMHDSVAQGWSQACRGAQRTGFALGFGSFETVGAILRLESTANRLDTGQ